MGTTPMGHLAEILDEHDGDDRCQCLRNAVWALANDGPEATDGVIRSLSACLANHPAGLTMRERFNRSVDRSP